MDARSKSGGILTVLEVIDTHKAAFVYDFRHRFGVGLQDLGTVIPWDEVVSLASVLLADPTSWLQAARSKWQHPIDYNWTVLTATYDLLAQVHSKRKPQPWPRPWPTSSATRVGRTRRDARAILARAKNGDMEWQNRHTRM